MQPVNIICIKWGTKYGSDYVNKLYSMVSRNISIPYRFVCLTDDADDIIQKDDIKPNPTNGFEDFDQRNPWTFAHGMLKLVSFAETLYDQQGPTLFLDQDIVIVSSLDDIFEPEGDFLVIKKWD